MKLNRQPLNLFSIGMKWETRRVLNIEFSQWNSTHTFSKRGSATEIHWGSSVFNGLNFAPTASVTQAAELNLVCSKIQGQVLLKTSKMIMIGAELLHSQICKKDKHKHKPQFLDASLPVCSLLWVPKTRGRNTQKIYPYNVSCKYVCLHIGCFIALNISVGSYIKHSLYAKLPFIYLFILPRASSGLYNSMLSILALHYLWTHMQTWLLKGQHSAYMQLCLMTAIILLTWSYIYTDLSL